MDEGLNDFIRKIEIAVSSNLLKSMGMDGVFLRYNQALLAAGVPFEQILKALKINYEWDMKDEGKDKADEASR